jgi:hypothetical protein
MRAGLGSSGSNGWRPEAGFAGREARIDGVASLRRRKGLVGEPGVPPRLVEVES